MNTRLLRKVQKKILENPGHFDMDYWAVDGDNDFPHICYKVYLSDLFKMDINSCGSTACIAGWSVLCASREEVLSKFPQGKRFEIEHVAYSLLGLSDWQEIEVLFKLKHWPDKFRRRFERATRPETKARIASARIDHFIKTKGKE